MSQNHKSKSKIYVKGISQKSRLRKIDETRNYLLHERKQLFGLKETRKTKLNI